MRNDRPRASSGSPFEASIGFSRGVRAGNRILVSGTAPVERDPVGRAHRRWFGGVRPASTMIVVAGLLRPEWRVEIEAEAEIA